MQHALVALQLEKPSSYSIYNFVISLFGCPLPWMPGAVVPFAPPPMHATDDETVKTKNCASTNHLSLKEINLMTLCANWVCQSNV